MSTNDDPKIKKSKHRSPNHPLVNLEKAVELTGKLRDKYGKHEAPVKMVHGLFEYKEGSAAADQCVAALKAYGLITVTGKGDDRKVAVSIDGEHIVRNGPDREVMLRRAAVMPGIHREILKHYGDKGLPIDGILRNYLLWERPVGQRFNEDIVDAFIKRLRETLAYAKVDEKATIDGEDSGGEGDDEGDESPPPADERSKPRVERKRQMSTGFKEDVFSLDEGPVVLQWPERLSKASADDLDDWLKLIGRKIKRAISQPAPEPPDDDEQEDE